MAITIEYREQQMLFINHQLASKQYAFGIVLANCYCSNFDYVWCAIFLFVSRGARSQAFVISFWRCARMLQT